MGEGGGEGRGGNEIWQSTNRNLFHNGRESSTRVLFLSLAKPKTRQRSFIK